MIKSLKEGCQIAIKVIPKASSNEIVGWENEYLKVRLRAIPEKGNANSALIEFLSDCLKIAKSNIQLTHGHTSRIKRLLIVGISKELLEQKLSTCM